MDPLSDLLKVIHLDGAYFYTVEAAAPWSVETVPARDLTPRIMPRAEHLISYHIVTEGRCFGFAVGEHPIELVAGDVIVFPQGDAHIMASAPVQPGDELKREATPRYPFHVQLGPPGPPATQLMCGFLGCDRRPFNPLLAALPRQLHFRGMSTAWLGTFVRQVTDETQRGRPGADGVLTRLAELMFIDAVRRHLDDLPPGQTGWLAGLRDEIVGQAITLLHSRPAHAWTLDELARETASSRTILAKRFTALVGQPPMQYLAQWRMQVAADLLTKSGAKVSAIASDVGYESEAAFSRAFKKATGLAPGAWRESRRLGS
jgi:AraC-like DNA-binding protein